MGFLLFSLANKPLTCTLIQAGDISWLRLYVEKTRRNVDLGRGGGLYYVSFTCYLSGIVMTNRDNQSLQQLLRFRIRWVGSYFFGRKRESSTNIHPIRDEFNVQTCKLGRPVTWNDMERRFWHSGWRQIQKSPSFNTKQWSSLELVVTEHKSWCICPAQGHDDFGTFTGTEPPNLHPHLLKPAEIFETTVLRLQAKKNKNKHDF